MINLLTKVFAALASLAEFLKQWTDPKNVALRKLKDVGIELEKEKKNLDKLLFNSKEKDHEKLATDLGNCADRIKFLQQKYNRLSNQ